MGVLQCVYNESSPLLLLWPKLEELMNPHLVFMACQSHGALVKSRGSNLYPLGLEAMSHIFRALYAEQRPVGNFIAFLFYAPFYGKVGSSIHSSSSPLVGELGKSMGLDVRVSM